MILLGHYLAFSILTSNKTIDMKHFYTYVSSHCHSVARYCTVVVLLLVMVGGSLAAQESVMEIAQLHVGSPIVRALGDGERIVCCKDNDCRFLRITSGNGTVDEMILSSKVATVSDVKVYGGRVYFCGMSSYNVPYMANFDIATFPAPGFEMELIAEASEVRHIDVYGSRDTKLHVVMTGQDRSGYGMLIEAMSMTVGWHMYFSLMYDEKGEEYIFDDIAVSDTLVAVTAYERESRDSIFVLTGHRGRVWFLRRPNSDNSPLVGAVSRFVDVPYDILPPFLTHEAEPNTFVAAAVAPIPTLYVSSFIGTTHYSTATLQMVDGLKDLSYNPASRTTEVLVVEANVISQHDVVYSLLPGMATVPGMAYGHHFDGYRLSSLDYLPYNVNHFVGAGRDVGSGALNLFQYHFNFYLNCSVGTHRETKLSPWEGKLQIGKKQNYDEIYAETGATAYRLQKYINTVCVKRITESD